MAAVRDGSHCDAFVHQVLNASFATLGGEQRCQRGSLNDIEHKAARVQELAELAALRQRCRRVLRLTSLRVKERRTINPHTGNSFVGYWRSENHDWRHEQRNEQWGQKY